jgi:hypothetical protein
VSAITANLKTTDYRPIDIKLNSKKTMNSKTLWMLLGLLLFSGMKLCAQNFKFGFIAGMDIAKSHLKDKPDIQNLDYYPMISYNLNGYIGYKSSRLWGLTVEPGFIQKGFVFKNEQYGNIRSQINYIQLPMLLDIYLTKKICLSAGPEIAYMINAKLKLKEHYPGSNTDSYDKRLELSGIIGLNYKITEKFSANFRYNYGLTYIRELTQFENSVNSTEIKEYNQYFQLSIRYKLVETKAITNGGS